MTDQKDHARDKTVDDTALNTQENENGFSAFAGSKPADYLAYGSGSPSHPGEKSVVEFAAFQRESSDTLRAEVPETSSTISARGRQGRLRKASPKLTARATEHDQEWTLAASHNMNDDGLAAIADAPRFKTVPLDSLSGNDPASQRPSANLLNRNTGTLLPPSSTECDRDNHMAFLQPSATSSTSSFNTSRNPAVSSVRHRFEQHKQETRSTEVPGSEEVDSDDEWDYSETEWWGWVVLIATWLLFVVVMGSCFGVWSWAWDVGETPYAPPELEDDATLPITGYYPVLMVCTAIMAWVWVVVAWVGMKYFRHAKVNADG